MLYRKNSTLQFVIINVFEKKESKNRFLKKKYTILHYTILYYIAERFFKTHIRTHTIRRALNFICNANAERTQSERIQFALFFLVKNSRNKS